MAHTWRKLALRRKFDETPAGLSNKHVTAIAWVGSLLTLFTKPSSIVCTFPSIFIKQPANPLIPKGIQGYDQYIYIEGTLKGCPLPKQPILCIAEHLKTGPSNIRLLWF